MNLKILSFLGLAWKGRNFAFVGHTDVVPSVNIRDWKNPPFETIIKNGLLFRRVTADMKGFLADMIGAAHLNILFILIKNIKVD
ncbi:MAG: M20/M25/M40 family metallo-hydrolase [Candidatus Dasytiphilus stammeri]